MKHLKTYENNKFKPVKDVKLKSVEDYLTNYKIDGFDDIFDFNVYNNEAHITFWKRLDDSTVKLDKIIDELNKIKIFASSHKLTNIAVSIDIEEPSLDITITFDVKDFYKKNTDKIEAKKLGLL